jgi:hypothetical protein
VQSHNRESSLSGWRVANLIQSPPSPRLWPNILPYFIQSGEIMGRKPKTTGPSARDPGAFKSVLVRINIEGWRALKVLAIEQEATLNALAVEAFNDLLKKHGKRQSVENPLLD